MPRYKIILNPTADKGAVGKRIDAVQSALKQYNLDYSLSLTERAWHAAGLAREAAQAGYAVVVAVGGDGTVNEVVNGILSAQEEGLGSAALGVLPLGRGNDFCFANGIPNDFQQACTALARANVRAVDAGRISGGLFPNGRYFGNGVGIGFDAVVSRIANQAKLAGFISYLIAALQTIYIYYQAPDVQIELSGETIQQRSLMVSIMNGRRAGGGFLMAPHGDTRDGYFDICIARDISKASVLALIPRFMNGTQGTHPAIQFKKDTRVTVRALNGSLPAHVDGELVSIDAKELAVEILPGRLRVITG